MDLLLAYIDILDNWFALRFGSSPKQKLKKNMQVLLMCFLIIRKHLIIN